MEQRKGSLPLVNQSSLQLYSPTIENSLDHFFGVSDKRHYDIKKIREMREMLKEEAIAQIRNKRPIDPYNKYP